MYKSLMQSYLACNECSDVMLANFAPPVAPAANAAQDRKDLYQILLREYVKKENVSYGIITTSLLRMPKLFTAVVNHADVLHDGTPARPHPKGSAAWRRVNAEVCGDPGDVSLQLLTDAALCSCKQNSKPAKDYITSLDALFALTAYTDAMKSTLLLKNADLKHRESITKWLCADRFNYDVICSNLIALDTVSSALANESKSEVIAAHAAASSEQMLTASLLNHLNGRFDAIEGNIAANLSEFKRKFVKYDKARNKQTDDSASQSGSNVSGQSSQSSYSDRGRSRNRSSHHRKRDSRTHSPSNSRGGGHSSHYGPSAEKKVQFKDDVSCYRCGGRGHFANTCSTPATASASTSSSQRPYQKK